MSILALKDAGFSTAHYSNFPLGLVELFFQIHRQ